MGKDKKDKKDSKSKSKDKKDTKSKSKDSKKDSKDTKKVAKTTSSSASTPKKEPSKDAEAKPKAPSTPKEAPKEAAPASSSSSTKKGGLDLGKKIGYEDMTTMENMTLDGVLQNLEDRYAEDLIYTYTSSILVAINPYKRLPIYTDRHVKAYKGVRLGKQPPHIFAVAETAYTCMIQHELNQSVLVSGESGAGKTESTKKILQFLSARTDRTSDIEKMVLASVPVLESMGNAKTGRNDNSSRFGKLIKIQFDDDYYITGSSMSSYLLEKSRLIFQAEGERNFHIFYQMTMGMKPEEKKKFYLDKPEKYNYINMSGCYTVKDVEEPDALLEFREALTLFDVQPDLEEQMFKVLASVLHLGNVVFKEDGDKSQIKDAESQQELEWVSNMLGVEPPQLLFALSHREIKMRNEIINKPLTADQTRDQTDALSKYLYSVLFDWLVYQLNVCTVAEEFRSFIGVLDIFGFEVFKKNSFEQFLINFANEKLQQFFNHQIFKLEQKIYEEEKIDWTIIEFKDNQECLDLIEQRRPPGILSILDEECKFPKATDTTTIEKLHANFDKKHPHYEKPRLAKLVFIVKHFAGAVDYDVEGWRDKNKDELPENLTKVICSSQNMFVAILYSPDDQMPESSMGKSPSTRKRGQVSKDAAPAGDEEKAPSNVKLDLSAGGARSPRKPRTGESGSGSSTAPSKETLGAQFKNQLQALMDLLGATEPYFIRCVKPNPQKIPNNFDRELIYNQLLYAGMLETIRIRRMGYPIRYNHRDFFKRFRVICPEVGFQSEDKVSADKLAKALGLDIPYKCQLGLTKVFLKQETANELEDRRNFALTHIIVLLQRWWRMASARGHLIEYRRAAQVLQTWTRMAFPYRKFRRERKASKLLQRWWRMVQAQRLLSKLREIKRKEEEERKRKEEEERKKRIEKYGLERVKKEEELKRKLQEEADEAEKAKIQRLLAGLDEPEPEPEVEVREKKRKKKKRMSRTGSIKMDRNQIVEVPINVDGKITVGLGWKGKQVNMDASCLMFRYREHKDDVYKFKPRSRDGAVIHKVGWTGGLGLISTIEGSDNHQIDINLKKLSDKINTLVFVVTLFTEGANFSEIDDAYVRLIDASSKKEYCRYTIEGSGKETAKIMCKLFRYGYSGWRLKAIGHPSQGRLYKHMIGKVNAFLEPFPPKKTLKVTVHQAKITDGKRHVKEDSSFFAEVRFDLTKAKTKTAKKTLTPTWEQDFTLSGMDPNLEVTLMHKRGFAKQGYIARVVIPLEEYKDFGKAKWLSFEEEETAQCSGQIELTIKEA